MTKSPISTIPSVHVAVTHYFYCAALAIGLLLFDVWKLLPIEQLRIRWLLIIILLAATAILHQLALTARKDAQHRAIIYIFIGIDLTIAAFLTYLERGTASNAVALFAVPIVIASVLKSSRALLTIASLSLAFYAAATISYFLDNPFEELRVRLYGTLVFYGLIFFVLAWFMRKPKSKK